MKLQRMVSNYVQFLRAMLGDPMLLHSGRQELYVDATLEHKTAPDMFLRDGRVVVEVAVREI